jgi:hypothetical protein
LKVEKGLEYLFYMISMSIKVFYGNFWFLLFY